MFFKFGFKNRPDSDFRVQFSSLVSPWCCLLPALCAAPVYSTLTSSLTTTSQTSKQTVTMRRRRISNPQLTVTIQNDRSFIETYDRLKRDRGIEERGIESVKFIINHAAVSGRVYIKVRNRMFMDNIRGIGNIIFYIQNPPPFDPPNTSSSISMMEGDSPNPRFRAIAPASSSSDTSPPLTPSTTSTSLQKDAEESQDGGANYP